MVLPEITKKRYQLPMNSVISHQEDKKEWWYIAPMIKRYQFGYTYRLRFYPTKRIKMNSVISRSHSGFKKKKNTHTHLQTK